MPDFDMIKLETDGGVAELTLSRPEKYNAVNMQMHGELASALKQLQRDRDLRAVIFTGEGKGFCAGQDLAEFGMFPDDHRVDDHVRTTFNRFVLGLRELPVPVIGAINGIAAGAGASLALATDVRLMADNATLLQAFIRIGLVPDTGSTWLLPQLVGMQKALELAWTGDSVDAVTAVDLGLALRVVPAAELMTEARAFAHRLAAMPTRAIGMTKRAMYRSLTTTFADALEYEAQLQQVAVHTHDHREGVMAFLEKRDPAFTGS